MKIRYQFVNENVEVDVEEMWGSILLDLDRQEYNNNQKETRRHTTLDKRVDEGEWLSTEDKGLAALFAGKSDVERINRAISQLKPKQQELINAIFYKGISVNDYAVKEGVDQSAISHRLRTIYKRLKKLL